MEIKSTVRVRKIQTDLYRVSVNGVDIGDVYKDHHQYPVYTRGGVRIVRWATRVLWFWVREVDSVKRWNEECTSTRRDAVNSLVAEFRGTRGG